MTAVKCRAYGIMVKEYIVFLRLSMTELRPKIIFKIDSVWFLCVDVRLKIGE